MTGYRCKLDTTVWQDPSGLYQHWLDDHDGTPGYVTPDGLIASPLFAGWALENVSGFAANAEARP